MKSIVVLFSSIALMVVLLSCERQNDAAIDPNLATPFISSASLAGGIINLDDTTSAYWHRLPDGTFSIRDSVVAYAEDRAGGVPYLSFSVLGPDGSTVVQSGSLNPFAVPAGNAVVATIRFGGIVSFAVNRSDIGLYQVELTASGVNSGNTVRVPLMITRTNSAPNLGVPSVREMSPAGSDSTQLTVTIAASDSDGFADVSRVQVITHNVQNPSTVDLLDNGSPSNGDHVIGDGIFSAIFWVKPLTTPDAIQLEFVATDARGDTSRHVLKTLTDHPPHIVHLDVPDSIQRPTSGAMAIVFAATVQDSDGLGDIDSVYFRNFSATVPTNFLMYDDGDFANHGDVTAGDGIYSLAIQINSGNPLGVKEFHFYAVDKSGARDEVIKLITIY